MENHMEIDRKELITSLGGEAAVKSMDHEARADALEDFLSARLDARCRAAESEELSDARRA
jgi:hypothetical protein